MRKIRTGFMFIELLLVFAIVAFVVFKVFELYFKDSPIRKETQESVILEQGVDTTNYKSIIDSSKEKLEGVQEKYKYMEKLVNTANE